MQQTHHHHLTIHPAHKSAHVDSVGGNVPILSAQCKRVCMHVCMYEILCMQSTHTYTRINYSYGRLEDSFSLHVYTYLDALL